MIKIDFNKYIDKINNKINVLVDSIENDFAKKEISLIVNAGGKRLRPILVLIGASYGNKITENVILFASLIELFHTATLIHDDVVDNADLRRGIKTINAKYDDKTAINIGNILITFVLKEIANIKNKQLHKKLSNAFLKMAEGEILQYNERYKINFDKSIYFEKIIKKTALLIELSLFGGGILSNCDLDVLFELSQIGLNLGKAFQIRDDVIDYIKSNEKKTTGIDLLNGQITLPIIVASKKIKFDNLYFTQKDAVELIKFVDENDIIKCKNIMMRYLNDSKRRIIKIGFSKYFFDAINKLKYF